MKNIAILSASLLLISSCSNEFEFDFSFGGSEPYDSNFKDAFVSTYKPMESRPILFKSANIYDGIGGELLNYDLLIVDGKIKEIGQVISRSDVEVIDASNNLG